MIRLLTDADLDAALELSSEAGWNQLRGDWSRLLDLAPDGCFGYWLDDTLAATCTVISYEDVLSWIGMMLVRRSHRRQGLGRKMFEHAIENAGDTVIGLDATEYGRPLYAQYGLEEIGPVTRWRGRIAAQLTQPASTPVQADAILPMDLEIFGTDRGPLLRRLAQDGNIVAVPDAAAYAFLRPGRTAWQVGPIVASDGGALTDLLSSVALYTSQSDVVIDVVDRAQRRSDVVRALEQVGLKPDRLLVRMATEPSMSIFGDHRVIAAAGLELG